MIAPIPSQDIHAGREAFQRDLERALRDVTLADKGWVKPDDLTLFVPFIAQSPDGLAEALTAALQANVNAPPASVLHAPRFAPGHWRHFAGPLAEAFALLTPVAKRLGYAE